MSSNSFLETTLILYSGYLAFHHLLIEIATSSKSWAQILTHKILVFLASLKKHYFIYPEQEKAPAIIFLKIGAWPNAYKKKVDDVRVIAILEGLLSFKFDTFENAEFI